VLILRQVRRTAAAAVVVLVATAAGVATWMWLPAHPDRVRPIPTGASFNLTVAHLRDARSAVAMTARLESAGWPAFTRPLRSGARHEVLVGPYVAIDEVERVQRRLRAGGYRATMIVDESVRRVPRVAAASLVRAGPEAEGAHLVLVGAAGRFSLVLEMPDEPREVITPRGGGSLVEVQAGPWPAPALPRLWNGPEGVDLVNQIAVDAIDRGGERFIRTRVALANAVRNNVRVVGRRVYIDFWMPDVPAGREGPPYEPQPNAPPPDSAGRALTARQRYRDAIEPPLARFEAIEPFLLSAVATTPSSEVMGALERMLSDLDASVRAIEPPADAATAHASMIATVERARASVRADFDGDRRAQALAAFAELEQMRMASGASDADLTRTVAAR
jgi:hypothetical protein